MSFNFDEWRKYQNWLYNDPRTRPYVPPVQGIFDAPHVKLCLNQEWARLWLSGVIGRLEYPDVYSENEEEAIQEILKLQTAIGGGFNPCEPANVSSDECAEYGTASSIISYAPMNPYTQL